MSTDFEIDCLHLNLTYNLNRRGMDLANGYSTQYARYVNR